MSHKCDLKHIAACKLQAAVFPYVVQSICDAKGARNRCDCVDPVETDGVVRLAEDGHGVDDGAGEMRDTMDPTHGCLEREAAVSHFLILVAGNVHEAQRASTHIGAHTEQVNFVASQKTLPIKQHRQPRRGTCAIVSSWRIGARAGGGGVGEGGGGGSEGGGHGDECGVMLMRRAWDDAIYVGDEWYSGWKATH